MPLAALVHTTFGREPIHAFAAHGER